MLPIHVQPMVQYLTRATVRVARVAGSATCRPPAELHWHRPDAAIARRGPARGLRPSDSDGSDWQGPGAAVGARAGGWQGRDPLTRDWHRAQPASVRVAEAATDCNRRLQQTATGGSNILKPEGLVGSRAGARAAAAAAA